MDKEYIIKKFDRNEENAVTSNSVKNTGIITSNEIKATIKIWELYDSVEKEEVSMFIDTAFSKILKLKNGNKFEWVSPNGMIRGYRFNYVYVDKNIKEDDLTQVRYHCCKFINNKKYIEVF